MPVAKAYARWAPVYDFVFGAVFAAGRKASIAAAERVLMSFSPAIAPHARCRACPIITASYCYGERAGH